MPLLRLSKNYMSKTGLVSGFFIVNMAKDSWVHLLNISDLKLHNMPFL